MTYREEQFMKQMTEIAIEVAELRAENKLLKSFNDSLLQALHKPVVVRPASAVERGGELLATEAMDTLAEAGEETRKDFCIWYYAQSQPLDANKVFAWFLERKSSDGQA